MYPILHLHSPEIAFSIRFLLESQEVHTEKLELIKKVNKLTK